MSFCTRHPECVTTVILDAELQQELIDQDPYGYGPWPVSTHYIVVCQACVKEGVGAPMTVGIGLRPPPAPSIPLGFMDGASWPKTKIVFSRDEESEESQ